MGREATLPPLLEELRSQVHYVQRVGAYKYTSSCPKCGGQVHSDGTWPNRFIMWCDEGKNSHQPRPRGHCQRCNFQWFPDKGDDWKPDPEATARWEAERAAQAEQRRQKEAEYLDDLSKTRVWETYAKQLWESDYGQAVWKQRGIDPVFADYWKLGYEPLHVFWTREGEEWKKLPSPTLTIPILRQDGSCWNIRHRLLDKDAERILGKYRPEKKLPARLFVANLDKPIEDYVVAVEGEIKAMVVHQTLDTPQLQVVGLPGMSPSEEVIHELDKAGPIIIILDPDAHEKAVNLAHTLGPERSLIVDFPMKIDDAIIKHGLNKGYLKRLIRMARPVTE